MMKPVKTPALLALAALALAGCEGPTAEAQIAPAQAQIAQARPLLAAKSQKVLATLDGEPIYANEVQPGLAFQLYRIETDRFALLKGETEELIDKRLLAREAARRAVSVEELLHVEVDQKVPIVGEAEIDAYLREHPEDAHKGRAARARASAHLSQKAALERRLAFLKELRAHADYKLLLETPERPRAEIDIEGAPARGDASAPITLVHFASFTSKDSARSAATLRVLAARHAGKIRWVHRHFVDTDDETGLFAAEVALAAEDAGHFWELHDKLFAAGGALDEDKILTAARELRLRVADAERREQTYLPRLKKHKDAGTKAGVDRPPVVFINGRYFDGGSSYERLEQMIDQELRQTEEP